MIEKLDNHFLTIKRKFSLRHEEDLVSLNGAVLEADYLQFKIACQNMIKYIDKLHTDAHVRLLGLSREIESLVKEPRATETEIAQYDIKEEELMFGDMSIFYSDIFQMLIISLVPGIRLVNHLDEIHFMVSGRSIGGYMVRSCNGNYPRLDLYIDSDINYLKSRNLPLPDMQVRYLVVEVNPDVKCIKDLFVFDTFCKQMGVGCNNVEEIMLESVTINKSQVEVLRDFYRTIKITLTDCKIELVEDAFKACHEVSITNCRIGSLSKLFGPCLRKLTIHNDEIVKVTHEFVYLVNLEYIDLSYNKIVNVKDLNLEAMPNLKYLILKYNKFEGMFRAKHDKLEYIDISGNNITRKHLDVMSLRIIIEPPNCT